MVLSFCHSFLLMAHCTLLADANLRVEVEKAGGIAIVRPTVDRPLLVFNAPEYGRPYLHPLLAPDGQGVLTQYSPQRHQQQSGIYFGFRKVNGRDYIHNRGADYFRRIAFEHEADSQGVIWHTSYELLDAHQATQLVEHQTWHFRDFGKTYLIDFRWQANAQMDITFDRIEYGGLFVRMPFQRELGSQAVNSEGQINGKAEGQRARWVDISMPLEGRKDLGHIAVIAHAGNPGMLSPWRVDGQLGVGSVPSRAGALKLAKGESATFRYRFLVYTGEIQQSQVEAEWKAFSSVK